MLNGLNLHGVVRGIYLLEPSKMKDDTASRIHILTVWRRVVRYWILRNSRF